MSAAATVLVADDSVTVRRLLSRVLRRAGFEVIEAADGVEALVLVLTTRPVVAVLDHEMPGCTGMEVLRRLRTMDEVGTAVLLLTGTEDRRVAAEALEAGAVDFVRKGCPPAELVARVRKAVEMHRLIADLDRRSSTDPLTGLPNRRGVEAVLAALAGPAGTHLGLLLVDVDRFKSVNDDHGHEVGDLVLQSVATRLAAAAAPFTAARWGGEEFLAAGRCIGWDELGWIGERLRMAISATPIRVASAGFEETLSITVSVGGALLADGADVAEAIGVADACLYAAKASGRDRVVLAENPDAVASSPAADGV